MRNFSTVIHAIIFAIMIVCLAGCASQESAQEEKNKAIARLYMEDIWNNKDMDSVDKLVSDDFINHSSLPGMPPNRDGLKQFISFSGNTFPDGHYAIEDMIAEGNRVMMRGSFRGTHRGEFMGVPGTGKEITNTWIVVLSIENGKVTERWGEYDALGMNLQIGFKFVPPSGKSQNPFIGTWKLQSFEQRNADDPNSPPVYPMGRDLDGFILYSDDGHMAVTLMKENRPAFLSEDLRGGTTDEKKSAFETYISYCGKYIIQGNEVIHQIEASLFPNWTGIDQKRLYEFKGDSMTLSTPPFLMGGINQTVRLVWKRVK